MNLKRLRGQNGTLDENMKEYLTWGGFPMVCKEMDENSKMVILSNIFDSVVLKDIVMRNKVASPAALEIVLEYLVANSSTTISGNGIAASLSDGGQPVSAPMVYDYMRFITDACVCDKVSRYDIRGKKILSFEEKTYVCDLGFFHIKKSRVKDEYNYVIETLCYNELISRGYQVYIGKTHKGEIDFIATRGSEKIYVQAVYLLADETVAEREFGAYRNVQDHYPQYVVSMDKMTVSRDGITHMNLIDFCLKGI